MRATKCRVCLDASRELNEKGLCDRCDSLAEIVRRNLEGAAKSNREPPTQHPNCEYCGVEMKPLLLRPDGAWLHYCVTGCHFCTGCDSFVRGDKKCSCWHCGNCYRLDHHERSVRPIPNGERCKLCGAQQNQMETVQ